MDSALEGLVANEHLDKNQYQESQSLCSNFQDMLQDKPGCTMLNELLDFV